MYRLFFLLFSIPLLFISCNNDDDTSSQPIEEANFYALTIGNTWKYEYFQRDFTTNEFETTGVIEEVLITETTEVDGEVFFTFQSTTTGENNIPCSPEFGVTTIKKRDSIGYLIDSSHSILFSNEILTNYLISYNDWGDVYGVLLEDTESIEVEAGIFNANRNDIFALLAPNEEVSPGRDNIFYSDGKGEVLRTYSGVSNPDHNWEKRLISFNILD